MSEVDRQTVEGTGVADGSVARLVIRVLVAYVAISTLVIGAWYATVVGYVWPAWALIGSAAVIVLTLWRHHHGPVTQEDLENEARWLREEVRGWTAAHSI